MNAVADSPRGRFAGGSPLRAAWHGFANQMHWWSWALVALVALGFPALMSLRSLEAGVATFGLLMLPVLIGLWGQLVSSTLQQNHPALARLLPSQPRRLRLTLVLGFLVLGTAAALASEALHKPSLSPFCILALLFTACGVRWPLTWATTALLGFGPLMPPYLPRAVNETAATLTQAAATPLGLACLLAVGSVFLASFVRDGGSAHDAFYERLQKRRRALKASMAGEAVQSGWFGRQSSRGYRREFERALSHAEVGRAGFKREMLALGPQAHISATMQGMLVYGAILAFVLVVLRLTGTLHFTERAGEGFANSLLGLIGVLMGGATQLRACLVRRRHEQALVSLLPGVPRGRAFNRQLAMALMGQYLALWALGSVLTSLLLLTFAGTQYALIAFCTTALGGGLVLWRDWTSGGLLKGWLAILVYLPLMGVAFVARIAMERGALSVGGFLTLAALGLASLCAWRWRAALLAPMAWPVGRRG